MPPKITFSEMIDDMVNKDLKLFKSEALLKHKKNLSN